MPFGSAHVSGERRPLVELKAFCAVKLPAYMIPERFVFHTTLPRTARGKIDFDALRQIPAGDLRDFAAVEALCIVPSSGRPFELFMDHPPLEKRLAHLAEIGRELGTSTLSKRLRQVSQ